MRSVFHCWITKTSARTALAAAVFGVRGYGQESSRVDHTDSLTQHYRAGAAFLSRGDPEHAAAEYRAFLAEALHHIANADAQIAEVSKADEYFAQALQLDGHDSALLDDYAASRFDQNQLAEAEKLLNSALELDAGDIRAHVLLGRVFFNQEKYLAARPHLEFALEHGNAGDAWYLLGITRLKLQELASAKALFEKMTARLGESASTHFRLGLAYYTGDYPDEAIVEFKQAIALDPKALNQHYYLGLAYLGHNPEAGFAKAEPEFHAELALSLNDFRSHYMIGYIALKRGRMQEAERELSQARTLKPEDIGTLLLTSELFTTTNRDLDAEPLLRRAIALAGDSALNYEIIRAHYMLGRILQRTGRSEEAARELAISEDLRSKFRAVSGSTPKERSVSNPQQNSQQEESKPVSAEERSKANAFIHQLTPAIAEAFNNLGAIAANQQECPACVSYFQRAGEWDPSLQGLDRNIGRAAFLCKQYEQAVPPLARYLDQHADDTTVRSALGLSLFQLGDYKRVVKVLDPIKSELGSSPELSAAYATALAKIDKK